MAIGTPAIIIHQFKTVYKPDPADASKMRGVDWVIYGPIGSNEKTSARIKDISSVIKTDDMTNPAVQMAHMRWDFIRPAYEAWKAGTEMPETGTPLAAWNLITPEQAEVFRARGINNVEAIASMSGGHAEKIPLPNMLEIVKQAQMFLSSADQARAAADLAEKDRRIKVLEAETAERDDQIKQLLDRVNTLAEMVAESQRTDTAEGVSRFTAMGADELKAFIKERTGSLPKGNPSHATLVKQCEELERQPERQAA